MQKVLVITIVSLIVMLGSVSAIIFNGYYNFPPGECWVTKDIPPGTPFNASLVFNTTQPDLFELGCCFNDNLGQQIDCNDPSIIIDNRSLVTYCENYTCVTDEFGDVGCTCNSYHYPVIPEFGFIIGGITIVSAVFVFLFLRRR